MEVRHLGNTDFETIMECFLLSFENYHVQMPTDYEFYRTRWVAAGVRYDLSYGMFDGDKLVGFIINAIDKRQGHLTAYNSGTGVIPKYRGKRIVKSIYGFAIPDLVKNGITKCQLEVITENVRAIKSYEGIGFKVCKHYKCFKGDIALKSPSEFKLNKVSYDSFDWDSLPNQEFYSWDNQKESLANGNFDYYQVLINGKFQSYFVKTPDSGYIAQFEVLVDNPDNWNALFSAIKSITQEIRINNIDDRLLPKVKAVELYGLTNTVNQYEMELIIGK